MEHEPLEEYKHKLKLKDLSFEPPKFAKINCPSCNAKTPAENINITDKIAKCMSCDVVFPIQETIEGFLKKKNTKQEVIRPEGVEIFKYEDELDLSINQPLTLVDALPFIFIPLLPIIITLAYYTKEISIYGPLIAWAISMIPIINIINRHRHKIHINVDDQYLDVQWRPNKLIRNKRYAIDEIDQIYTKGGSGTNIVYMITNGIEGQKHVRLLWVDSLSKARFIEQEIERHLGIKDREIPEEK